ncbi:MAG: cytochrome c biogenesis protein CcdA [Hyphomicrobium sp.]|jgi:cytochrome c biogenesis protein CcdA
MLLTNVLLAALAGTLSTLSPCVLPLLPVVFATAAGEHRLGPAALATGLALSFAGLGIFIAAFGYGLGIDTALLRPVAAVLMLAIGTVLLVPPLQTQLAAAAAPVSNWTENNFGGFEATGLGGQFALGLLLGAVWSPCVGPTLGAASLLAAQGENLGQVSLTMLAFGLGAALPLLLLGLLSRETILHWRNRLAEAGKSGKAILGIVLILVAALILTGLDKSLEAVLVAHSPAWLTEITTRY